MKYLKIYWLLIRLSWAQQLQYRWNFVVDSILTVAWALMRVIFYLFTFNAVGLVGEWTQETALILTGVFMTVQAIYKMLFEENFLEFGYRIYHGELDPILLRPISAQFFLTMQRFTPRAIIRVAIGVVTLILAISYARLEVSWATLLFFLMAVAIALILMYSLYVLTVCLVFWVGNIDNVYHLINPILSVTFIPFDIFPSGLVSMLTFVLPLAFMATIPTQILLGLQWNLIAYGVLITTVFFWLSRWVWHQGLKAYTSVSS